MRYSTPFDWNDGNVQLDRNVIAAFGEHGISEQLFEDWIEGTFLEGSLPYQLLVARAYDNANGTKTNELLPQISDLPDFHNLE